MTTGSPIVGRPLERSRSIVRMVIDCLEYTEEDLLECGERICNLERYYNNLVGFDGDDDALPEVFLKEGETPGQGASEGEYCELEEMKDEYYDHRGWVDGVVPDEKLATLEIEIGPGTGVSDAEAGQRFRPTTDETTNRFLAVPNGIA